MEGVRYIEVVFEEDAWSVLEIDLDLLHWLAWFSICLMDHDFVDINMREPLTFSNIKDDNEDIKRRIPNCPKQPVPELNKQRSRRIRLRPF